MGINRGKQFENKLREQFEKVPDTLCLRLYDVTTGHKNQNNPCDLIVFRKNTLTLIECKAIHGNTLNFKSHIQENQWEKLLKYSFLPGVNAGIIVWFIDLDKTYFVPIWDLNYAKTVLNKKSFNAKLDNYFSSNGCYEIYGEKKRVFFEYNLKSFLDEVEYGY